MERLFETTSLNGMTLANRFVRSATWEGLATEDGACTQRLVDFMVDLAHGGVGLIITGHAYVSPIGKAGPKQLGAYSDDLIRGHKEMTEAVHKAGGKIVMQLAHAGCHANPQLTSLEPYGPSSLENEQCSSCKPMSLAEIQKTVEAFGHAAQRAKKAGFDGVQIHAAHGYLLSQFLSPFYNNRRDEYGGEIGNRAKIVLDVVGSIRSRVGQDFPVMIKMNSDDFVKGGMSVAEMLIVASMLERAGIDAVELSGGTICSGKFVAVRKGDPPSEEKEGYYREAAKKYKETISIPLMLVGGIRSYNVAQQLVEEGITDYISLSRPLIREPHLVNRWKSGRRSRATCQSDNLCFIPARKGEGIHCVVEKKLKGRAPE